MEGTKLVDEAGQTVVLRGVSTHGLTRFPKLINESLFRQISTEWNANLIRLAMNSTQYCGGCAYKKCRIKTGSSGRNHKAHGAERGRAYS